MPNPLRYALVAFVAAALSMPLQAQDTHADTAQSTPASQSRQDKQKALEQLKTQALTMKLTSRILRTTEVEWEQSQELVTLPGITKVVRMDGTNVVIIIRITPSAPRGDVIDVLFQSQVWIRDVVSQQLVPFLNSLMVSWTIGKPLQYYPLGRSTQGQETINLEVLVNRYQDETNP